MTRIAVLLSGQLVNAIIIIYAVGFWRSANRLPPGPHVVYPELIIIGLASVIALDVVMRVVKAARLRDPMPVPYVSDEEFDGPDVWPESPVASLKVVLRNDYRIAVVLGATIAMFLLVPRLGFFETAFLFLLVTYWFLGFRRIPQLLLLWSTTSVVIWFFFTRLLVVPQVPRGFLAGILG